MACWWAGRRSIPAVGRNLCAPPSPRYLAPRMYTVLVAILILDSLILTTAVLLQAGQGGGPAPLGGGAGTETIMGGRQATTFVTKPTGWDPGRFPFPFLALKFISPIGAPGCD